jgi:uncharacterized protein (DUF697 family)/GTP-binding protein EngB required for normal cell division
MAIGKGSPQTIGDEIMNAKSEKDFLAAVAEARAKLDIKRPNILICGYTGSGKTSLLKAILGDVVSADAIGSGSPKTQGFDYYENDDVRVWDSKGLEAGETEEAFLQRMQDFVRERQENPDVDEHIHLVWYAIQGPGARVTPCDKDLIFKIFSQNNVIVVITKMDITRPNQEEALKKVLLEAGVREKHIVCVSDNEGGSIGCKELMELSYEMLPAAYKDAFESAQQVDKERKIQAVRAKATKANAIITAAATVAAGTGFVPIPGSDAPLLVAEQTTMIASLAALYGVGMTAVEKGMLPFLAKTAGKTLATSLLKAIPGIGTLLGGTITATIAGTLTGAMGMYVKSYFEDLAIAKINGEPLPSMPWDPDLFNEFYQAYKAGQKEKA